MGALTVNTKKHSTDSPGGRSRKRAFSPSSSIPPQDSSPTASTPRKMSRKLTPSNLHSSSGDGPLKLKLSAVPDPGAASSAGSADVNSPGIISAIDLPQISRNLQKLIEFKQQSLNLAHLGMMVGTPPVGSDSNNPPLPHEPPPPLPPPPPPDH